MRLDIIQYSPATFGLFDFETIRAGAGRVEELFDRYGSLNTDDFNSFYKGYATELKISPEHFETQYSEAIKGASLIDQIVKYHSCYQPTLEDFQSLRAAVELL